MKTRSETYTVLIVVDGATTFVTVLEWVDTFHCTPQNICADMAFQSTEVQDSFRRFGIFTGDYTPWPNRAEAAVRVFKATLHDLCARIGTCQS